MCENHLQSHQTNQQVNWQNWLTLSQEWKSVYSLGRWGQPKLEWELGAIEAGVGGGFHVHVPHLGNICCSWPAGLKDLWGYKYCCPSVLQPRVWVQVLEAAALADTPDLWPQAWGPMVQQWLHPNHPFFPQRWPIHPFSEDHDVGLGKLIFTTSAAGLMAVVCIVTDQWRSGHPGPKPHWCSWISSWTNNRLSCPGTWREILPARLRSGSPYSWKTPSGSLSWRGRALPQFGPIRVLAWMSTLSTDRPTAPRRWGSSGQTSEALLG